MSKAAVIRYQTKPEAADENQRLIEKVFAELASAAPSGLRYTTVRLADGVTFMHVVLGDGDLLPGLSAFAEFQRDFGERVTAAPERTEAIVIGSYAG
jgi:hypothetical protein